MATRIQNVQLGELNIIRINDVPYFTVSNTPLTVLSIVVPAEKAINIDIIWHCQESQTMAAAYRGVYKRQFRRASAGNIVATGTPIENSGNGDFSGAQPSLVANANVGTQSIDIIITGKTATNIKWYLNIEYSYNESLS